MTDFGRELRLWLLAVLLIGGGLVLTRTPDWHAAGEAFLIAGVLAVTVDRYVKLRLREEIAHDVFFAALGVHLPRELKEEILAIGDCKLVRRDLFVTYKLSPHKNTMLVNCETQVAFAMHNLTDQSQPFRHEIAVPDAPSGCVSTPDPITFVKAQMSNGAVRYELTSADIVFDESDHGLSWGKEVRIPPHDSIRFWSTHRQVLPAEFEEPFIFAQPTIGVTVRVDAPREIEHVVIFDHRLGNDVESLPHDTWKIDAAFFANTLFRTVWKHVAVSEVQKPVNIGPRLRITPTAHETMQRTHRENQAG